MRYIKPDAGKLAVVANNTLKFGDYFGACVVVTAETAFFVTGLALAIALNVFFALLILGIVPLLVLQVQYYKGSFTVGNTYRGDTCVNEAIKIYNEIRGSFTDGYALPIVKKIIAHAQMTEDHDSIWGRCESCRARTNTLEKLVPNSSMDDSDILAAKQFLAARKEIDV